MKLAAWMSVGVSVLMIACPRLALSAERDDLERRHVAQQLPVSGHEAPPPIRGDGVAGTCPAFVRL